MHDLRYSRDFFLWCMSAVYLFAFSSLYVQIPGLYGDNGILPAKFVVKQDVDSLQELMKGPPSLLRYVHKIGLDVETGMDFLCLLGVAVSFLSVVFYSARDTISFAVLWILYFSLYQASHIVGQTFLWFQWDILLLEAGFLTIIVAPFNLQLPWRLFRISAHHQHDTITMWLVRWLLFRLMFASGVVKLTSGCPTWWGLTALTIHFESQCIPTPLAWVWHNLPLWFMKLSCVATFVIEIAVPFLFFVPVKSIRYFSFFAQILLQILIIITGNYNFFNLLTIALCVSLLDDDFILHRRGKRPSHFEKLTNLLFAICCYGYIGFHTWKKFSLKIHFSPFSVDSGIAFSEKQFDRWLDQVVPISIALGAVSLGYEVVISLCRCMIQGSGVIQKLWSSALCIAFSIIAIFMFCISLPSFTVINQEAQRHLPKEVKMYHSKVRDYRLVGSYGLFRRMTGVGGRPEVVIEGSNSVNSEWKEYHFLYKPGNLSSPPPVVAPHQPRLDWQMWFAALGNYQHNPWFVNLVYRLLTNQEEVLQLLDYNPFPKKPPRYIRAKLYHYYFTGKNKGDKWYSKKNWWARKEVSEYFPALDVENQSLVSYLKQNNIYQSKKAKRKARSTIGDIVFWIRSKLQENIKLKNHKKQTIGVLVHQDNVPVHKSVTDMDAIHDCGFNLIEHPPYSPDLAPSNFHLFPKLKAAISGTHFQSDDDVILAVDGFQTSQDKEFFKSGIEALKHR
ncbi:hypothetical protein FSP39_015246 [Pinctada imbricata]|uniref:Lipase maturation factor n=1 Tax=Pinctada imbricata TaxID=66713 RepID=A0AA88YDQ8_PINIB|nr:hypothetical protein FSP39_015246 [Pinctada imbricata]